MTFLILFPFFMGDFYLGLAVYYALIIQKVRGTKNIIFPLAEFIWDWEDGDNMAYRCDN